MFMLFLQLMPTLTGANPTYSLLRRQVYGNACNAQLIRVCLRRLRNRQHALRIGVVPYPRHSNGMHGYSKCYRSMPGGRCTTASALCESSPYLMILCDLRRFLAND